MKKIFDRKNVLTLVTAEEAKSYIGKQGYFGYSFKDLEEKIKEDDCDELAEIFLEQDTDVNIIFRPRGYESSFGLFLPVDKVKEVEEKKWRAFTLEEFDSLFQIGNVLFLRKKEDHNYIIKVQFIGVTSHRDQVFISLGNYKLTLQDWFCSYELNKNKMWQPFGVEE